MGEDENENKMSIIWMTTGKLEKVLNVKLENLIQVLFLNY